MIKNILASLGGLFVLLIILVGVFFMRWSWLDATSQQYARESITAIFSTLDYNELKKRADANLMQGMPEDKATALFANIARLGKLQAILDCVGQMKLNLAANQPLVVSETACKVKFEKDMPVITLILAAKYFHWEISGMNISSDYLVPPKK